VYSYTIGRLPGIIGEVLTGLDVILVMVGPVEIDFLTIVGNGIAFLFGVTTLGNEVAVLPVAAEKGIKMVVDSRLQSMTALCVSSPFLRNKIFSSCLCLTLFLG